MYVHVDNLVKASWIQMEATGISKLHTQNTKICKQCKMCAGT